MKEEKIKNLFIEEADKIGRELISRAKQDDYGVYWDTLRKEGSSAEWQSSEDIYSGNAGIILFLAELAHSTSNSDYNDFVKRALNALYRRAIGTPTKNYAFHTGRAGVAYLLSLLADFAGKEIYHKYAVELMDGCDVFLENHYSLAEFLNGAAGTLFVLTFLHSRTKDKRLISTIKKYIEFIYLKAEPQGMGVYWDRSEKIINGLCGISHGASGVGFVFQELSNYFKSPGFQMVADQAFIYEDQCFEKEMNNWPDFRKMYHNKESEQEFIEHYNSGNFNFFTNTSDMAAWCHGAPGIGLARLSKWQMSGERREYDKDISQAIDRTVKSIKNPNYNSFTLCHGLGGNGLLLREIVRRSNRPDLEAIIAEIGLAAIDQKNKKGFYQSGHGLRDYEDWSLFQGNAGVGYFYLQVASDVTLSSILNPSIGGDYYSEADDFLPQLPSLSQVLFEKKFPKTLNYLKSINLHFTSLEFASTFSKMLSQYEHYVSENESQDPRLEDVFRLEKTAFELDQENKSFSLLAMRRRMELTKAKEYLKESTKQIWGRINVTLVDGLKFISSKYDWDSTDDGGQHAGYFQSLLIQSPMGTETLLLNDFSRFLLELLNQSCSLKDILTEAKILFGCTTDADRKQVEIYVLDELRTAALLGIMQISVDDCGDSEILEFTKMVKAL